jgi:cytidyltransferase-like protein
MKFDIKENKLRIYSKKVVDINFINSYKKKNKNKKIILCHGVFDIVHPGHIRHLVYAKEKADVLIVSITADIHITKGIYRPHVPANLRALNLAAFEVVDFVIVDNNPEPYQILKKIKPNFFAKGFEYVEKKNRKTNKEEKILKSFGGKLIFTPGDYINSSTKLIKIHEPDLKYEKLFSLLDKYKITIQNIEGTVKKIKNLKIDIVGDTIVDTFTKCKTIGGQTKTPTLSLLFEKKIDYVGGAGVVAKHIAAANCKPNLITILGEDEFKNFVLEDLKGNKVIFNGIVDKLRPTVNKNVFISDDYRLLRVSKLDNTPIAENIVIEIIKKIKKSNSKGIIFSDFRHGIFSERNINIFKKAISKDKFTAADSQVASWWGNILEFKKFDLITPNEREARFALSDQVSGIRLLASKIYDTSKCKTLVLKLGKRGIIVCINNRHENSDSYFSLDSFAENVIDPVGSGDALLAYTTMAMLVSKCKITSTVIGLLAASCECEKDGNIAITKEDILAKIDEIKKNIFKN